MNKVITSKVLKGRIDKYLEERTENNVTVRINLPNPEYQEYFPEITFFEKGGRGGVYWGDCNIEWLKANLGQDLFVNQRFEVRVMSDRTLRYRLVPIPKPTQDERRKLEKNLPRL